jgi:NAD(P)-dependent dehydrogenase (short-subunit alcohol dehydrogenase family)
MRGLSGKVFVIAGGASGIGAAAARRLAEEGASVVVGDINGPAASETASVITSNGGAAIAVAFDSADEGSVHDLLRASVREFGGIDGWHNNAADTSAATVGVDLDHDATSVPIEVWNRTFAVNLTGYLFGLRAAIPALLERGGGAVVNTASDGAFAGLPNLASYNASKAGVLSLTRHAAARWGREGIRCNAVAPGFTLTDSMRENMSPDALDRVLASVPSVRLGEPADTAAAVAFLLSDDAAWVNGQVLSVNGGAGMR